jgi:hypothetical protein
VQHGVQHVSQPNVRILLAASHRTALLNPLGISVRHIERNVPCLARTSTIMSLLPLLFLVFALSAFQTCAQPSQSMVNATYASITNNIASVHLGDSYPSSIVSLAKAAPVVVNPVDNRVLVASATFKKGRVAVFSHEAILSLNGALLLNTAIWAAASAYAKPGKVSVAYLNSGDDVSQGSLPGQVRGVPLC